MVHPTHMERALTSLVFNMTCEPSIFTPCLRALVISVIQIDDHLFLWYTEASGVCLPTPCFQRCATHRLIAATTHDLRCIVSLCPIDFRFIPF